MQFLLIVVASAKLLIQLDELDAVLRNQTSVFMVKFFAFLQYADGFIRVSAGKRMGGGKFAHSENLVVFLDLRLQRILRIGKLFHQTQGFYGIVLITVVFMILLPRRDGIACLITRQLLTQKFRLLKLVFVKIGNRILQIIRRVGAANVL